MQKPKPKLSTGELTKRGAAAIQWLRRFVHARPVLASCLLIAIYLLAFQFSFLKSGDAWAESYAEYLDEAIRLGWSEVIAQNWAGYLTIIPSFFTETYVSLGGPLGYADFFFRYVVVIFTVLSAVIVAAKFNRDVIRSDAIRVILSLFLVAILTDVASFSFINVWYIGFVPVILYCLNPRRLSTKVDIAMGIFGALVALTKPFIILLPLIIYRMVRSRQYWGAGILFLATVLQSYQIVFNDKRGVVASSSFELTTAIAATITGTVTSLSKLLGLLSPSVISLAILFGLLVLAAYYLWKHWGFWPTIMLAGVLGFSVYTYALSPDLPAYTGWRVYQDMIDFNLKTQREILINCSLLLVLAITADQLLRNVTFVPLSHTYRLRFKYVLPVIAGLLFISILKPIDTVSAGVTNSPLNAFRTQLNKSEPSCVPLAPSTLFEPHATWHFPYKGFCRTLTHDANIFMPDFSRFNTPVDGATFRYDTQYFRLDKARPQAIVIPVIAKDGIRSPAVQLTDSKSGRKFEARVDRGLIGEVQLLTFNITGIPAAGKHQFTLRSDERLHGTYFKNLDTLATYPYFLDTKPL